MKTANAVNPNQITFRQLKEMVGKTGGMKLPKAHALELSGEQVLFTDRRDGCTITVYRNGLFIFRYGDKKTVYAVDRIRTLEYRFADGYCSIIEENDYINSPCLAVLYIAGDDRLVHNAESVEDYWQEFALENNGSDRSVFDESSDPEAVCITAEENEALHNRIETAIAELPKRRQRVIRLFYFEEMDAKAISDFLDIPLSTVYYILRAAEKSLAEKY